MSGVGAAGFVLALAAALGPQYKPDARPAEDFAEVARQADAARRADHVEQAIGLYQRGVALRPAWQEGWWYLGALLYEKNRWAEARDALAKHVELNPKSGQGQALLGVCQYHVKEYENALKSLYRSEALKFGGDERIREMASYYMAAILTRSGQFEASLSLLLDIARDGIDRPPMAEAAGIAGLRLAKLPSELTESERDLARAAGQALWDGPAGRRTRADKEFRELVKRYPTTPNLHYLYGSFLLASRPEEGLAELKRELELSPDHVPSLIQIAAKQVALGEAASALPYAERAVKLTPRSFAAQNVLGRALARLGRTEEGIRHLERARDLNPESPETRAVLAAAYRTAGRTAEAAREMEALEKLHEKQRREAEDWRARVAPR